MEALTTPEQVIERGRRTNCLLTARAVAEMLGVSSETILRWHRRGDLPSITLPSGAIRFREDEIEAWLVERTTLRRGDVTHPVERRPTTTIKASPTFTDEE